MGTRDKNVLEKNISCLVRQKEKYHSVILNLYNPTLNGGGTWIHRWTQTRREVCTNL